MANTTTYIIRNAEGTVTDSRTSPSMPYAHAVVNAEGRAVSWHLTEAAATAKARKEGRQVLPVEAHDGAKATVLRRLAKETTVSSSAATETCDNADTEHPGFPCAHPATEAVATAKKAPAKAAAKKAPAKKATPAAGGHKLRWFLYQGTPERQPYSKAGQATATGQDVTCSCGWDSATGGASNSAIHKLIKAHKAEATPAGAQAPAKAAKAAATPSAAKEGTPGWTPRQPKTLKPAYKADSRHAQTAAATA